MDKGSQHHTGNASGLPDLRLSMTRDPAPDGRPATVITLRNSNGMQVVVMDIGATWLSCRVPLAGSGTRELLLGQSTMPDFYASRPTWAPPSVVMQTGLLEESSIWLGVTSS
ncbi:hypothetical protein PCI56_01705 [Plesiomonas shigelloides subsp. oncorhynchi]|nr:hypothetical protein [Plesiomonas shigelloides]